MTQDELLRLIDQASDEGWKTLMPQDNTDARSSTTRQHGKGDNVAGDSVQGDKHS
ncbi:MAG: hypothetical protein WBC73_12645 [Phormidesmis sp.]